MEPQVWLLAEFLKITPPVDFHTFPGILTFVFMPADAEIHPGSDKDEGTLRGFLLAAATFQTVPCGHSHRGDGVDGLHQRCYGCLCLRITEF